MANVEASADLKLLEKGAVNRMKRRHDGIEDLLEEGIAAANAVNEKALRKVRAELKCWKTEIALCLRGLANVKKQTGEELFEYIGEGEALACDKFVDFMSMPSLAVDEHASRRLFHYIAGGSEGDAKESMTKETFCDFLRVYFKCVKATVLTDDITVKSKTVRRLEVDEVVEVLEGPTREEGLNVQRVKVRAVKDDAMGWASVAGNKGTQFLVTGGESFVCVKETTITNGASIAKSKTTRRLNVKEVVQVIEFAKKDKAGIERVKAKAVEDGVVGWITLCGNLGTRFLEICSISDGSQIP